jgi:hypothetical protein
MIHNHHAFCYTTMWHLTAHVYGTHPRFLLLCCTPQSGRRSRRSGGNSATRAPLLHHFTRVACPTRQQRSQHPHRLAGLWKGLYGPHGCELLALTYDFSERSARIVATKLTGTCRAVP